MTNDDFNKLRQYLMELDDKPSAKKKAPAKPTPKPTAGKKYNNPDVRYEKVPLKKKDPSIIDSIIAYLSGKTSERFTKMARRYARAQRIEKMLKAEKAKLNAEVKEACEELFDAADDVYTRVVDTATMVFKLSKAGETQTTKFDKEGYLAELEELTGLAVDELEKIRKRHETITKSKVASKLLAPREKGISVKTTEASDSGPSSKIHKYACNIANDTKEFLKSWDQTFDALKSDIEHNI